MIRPVPAALCLGLAAAFSAGAAAQDYVAPKPGVVFRFTVSRGPDPAASERMTIRIRAANRDIVSANSAAGRTQYIPRLARGVFTFEIAEAAIVFRHDYQGGTSRIELVDVAGQ